MLSIIRAYHIPIYSLDLSLVLEIILIPSRLGITYLLKSHLNNPKVIKFDRNQHYIRLKQSHSDTAKTIRNYGIRTFQLVTQASD